MFENGETQAYSVVILLRALFSAVSVSGIEGIYEIIVMQNSLPAGVHGDEVERKLF